MNRIPSSETIREARTVIERWCDDLERRQALPQNQGPDTPRLFAKTAFIARRELLGSGCNVGVFDERYLDDSFRAAVQAAISTYGDES